MLRSLRIDEIEENLVGCIHCDMIWNDQKGKTQSFTSSF